MTPSLFENVRPWSSTLGKMEYEVVAHNIMRILSRTGNAFREITWKEYKLEREKDSAANNHTTDFIIFEKPYFEKAEYLSRGDRDELRYFSRTYAEIIDKHWPRPKNDAKRD